jgi:hypothetical protein
MGEHYDSIKSKLQSWNNTACKANAVLPPRWCEVAFQGRSEYLPRANPSETSIRSLVKESMTIPEVKRNLYDPPDVWMPVLDPPDGDIDVLSIVENGVEFAANRQRIKHALDYIQKSKHRVALLNNNPEIVPGKGWVRKVNDGEGHSVRCIKVSRLTGNLLSFVSAVLSHKVGPRQLRWNVRFLLRAFCG